MPPGSGTEKSSFVYDPKVIGESEVKAQIRLIFTGKGGKVMQVIRSFQVSRQRNKTVFNTLDNTVAFQNATTGKVISNTYRASDVDRVIPEMLGVSSAVLEHVIFCHQEHCNWPLSPPKDVKQIFDDIFSATRYVTALERLRDNSKEYRRQQKEHESSLFALREYREQANQLSEDVKRKEEVVEAIMTRNKSIEPDLKKLRDASAALQSIRQNIEALEREAIQISTRIEERQEKINASSLPPCQQSLEEMLQVKKNFSHTVAEAEDTLLKKTNQLNAIQEASLSRSETALRLKNEIHLLERDAEQHEVYCKQLGEMTPGVPGEAWLENGSVNEQSVKRLLTVLKKNLEALTKEANTAHTTHAEALVVLEESHKEAQRQIDAEGKESELITAQLTSLRSAIQEAQAQKTALGGEDVERQLSAIQKEIQKLEESIRAAAELHKKGEHFQRRENIMAEIDTINQTLTTLRQVMHKKKLSVDGATNLAMERKSVADREAQIEATLQDELTPILKRIQVDVPAPISLSTASAKVGSVAELKQSQLQQVQGEISQTEQNMAVAERHYTTLLDEIASGDTEASHWMKTIEQVMTGHLTGYAAELEKARSSYEECCKAVYKTNAMSSFYEDYVEAAQKDNKCAVCDRTFSNEKERANFEKRNKELLKNTPQSVKQFNEASEKALTRVKELERIELSVNSVLSWNKKKPVLEKKVKELQETLTTYKAQKTDADAKKETIEKYLELVHQASRILFGLTMQQKDIQRKKTEVERAQRQMESVLADTADNDDYATKSYEDVMQDYEEENKRLLLLNSQWNEARRQEEGGNRQDLESELSKKKEIRHTLELKLAKLEELNNILTKSNGEIEGYKTRLAAIEKGKKELQEKLTRSSNDVSAKRNEFNTVENSFQTKIKELTSQCQRVEEVGSKIVDYLNSSKPLQLAEKRKELASLEESITKIGEEVALLNRDIANARKTIGEQHRKGAEIEEQLSILELKRACETDEKRLTETNQALSDLKNSKIKDVADLLGAETANMSLSSLQDLISAQLSTIEKTRAQQEGNMEAIVQDLNNLKTQLLREKYQDIEKRYRSTYLKVQTAEMAVKDVERYYSALEKAVQSYHQEKITQINRIIAELWSVTYRGSDIDTVEIHSETENTTTTAARRSYNYRVVMKRDNREIDMRGRCSAGQKVLASIIIRLALSEAFCSECGILALDEPTTNLDEDNARSLADALRALIESRRSVVKHFQLIVITHDEQFVRALGGQSLEKFFYVHKDREGAFSVIEERTFDQLFS
ncbi:DNA repair protein RAD50 [Angomonas deanei]|nr:DNA repair protein RAD50 [Angomonas deanei]|eukprot:EPY23414.1 DNA repair protein RAD50 [Angomonas deanei]